MTTKKPKKTRRQIKKEYELEEIRQFATATALIVLLNFMDKNSDKTSDNNGLETRNKKTA